jgi:uncharacterized UBP type Zn finger protein
MNNMKEKQTCSHVKDVNENTSSKTTGCEECEKEGTEWVALRLCLSCGHVGCCNSSEGFHATRHFKETGHPAMIALANRSCKWCYIHKSYS